MEQRVPPYNLEAEQAIIGIMIFNPNVISSAKLSLRPVDFYREDHTEIVRSIYDIPNGQVDLISLISHIRARGLLNKISTDYLTRLGESAVTSAAWPHWCRLIKDCSIRRTIIRSCQLASDSAFGLHNEIPEIISGLKEGIDINPDTGPDYTDNHRFYNDRWDDLLTKQNQEPGLFIDIPGLENDFYLEPGYIHCIAAESGIGKSAISLKIADHIAESYGPVAYYSLESTREMLSNRIMARRSRIALSRLHHRNIDNSQIDNFKTKINDLITSKLYLIDNYEYSLIEKLIVHAENFIQRYDLKLIVIDFLQMLYTSKNFRGSRHLEISHIVTQIKTLAKNLNIPILYTSQLRKDVAGKPTLDSLKESGDIRTLTDNIVFMWSPDKRGAEYEVGIFLAKGKEQEYFEDWLHFNGHFQDFSIGQKPEKQKKEKNWQDEA